MATNDLLKQYSTPNKRKEAGVNTAPVSRNKWSVYQKGGGLPEIDWSRIASSLSVGLNQIREDKIAKRVAIEAATDAQMAEINKLRDSQPASAMIMRGTERYKELLSVHMGLVRAGLRTPTETKIFTQNVMNDFGGMKSIMDTYTTWQDAALKKIDDGEATTLTEIGYNSIEGLGGTLEGVEMYFNEATGTMQLVKMLEDGEGTGNFTIMPNADKNPENFYNPAQVLGAMKFNEKVIDYNVATGAIVESLGTFVQAYAQEDGSVRKYTNFRDYFEKNTSMKNNDGSVMTYDEYLSSQAAPFTSNFNDTMQVLFSNGYQNDNPNAANYIDVVVANGKFLIKKDGKNLTQVPEDLQTAAENIIKNKIDAGIDRKVESTTPTRDSNTPSKLSGASLLDNGARTISGLNKLRGATSVEDMDLAIQELQGISGLQFEEIKETIEFIDGKNVVTGVTVNLGGKLIDIDFGKKGTDASGKEVFMPTSSKDFVQANYDYFNDGKISSDLALAEFLKKNTLINDVGQPGKGSRNKSYKTSGSVGLNQKYDSGGNETTLKDQLTAAYASGYKNIRNNDIKVMASGVEQSIIEAYEAASLDLPEGFKVAEDGNNIVMSSKDDEGIIITESIDVTRGGENDSSLLTAAVQRFLRKIK
jgi:hypothetical protein